MLSRLSDYWMAEPAGQPGIASWRSWARESGVGAPGPAIQNRAGSVNAWEMAHKRLKQSIADAGG
ncbi:hypothetical protein GCM10011611_24940 [Aliidongia dinghuensis]|uniref:Uncharacterized protein n=1 Tax=Aliidongia dinghuensis TaxID=1867774 RepID=A0A8J2YU27_9PROT|nr:hypothetical protein [Aliidongia dinghuensis]GGF18099.1 hypothetical protein GCM10011611_24940 [Aliidongia dinghuensis]